MAKLKAPGMHTAKCGNGQWRLSYDEDGNVVAFELWDHDPKMKDKIKTYEAFKIVRIA